jgi:hypothetical protein
MREKISIFVLLLVLASTSVWCQIKVATITDESTASSKTVMTDLRSKLASHPKQFTLVSTDASGPALAVVFDCMPRKPTEGFVCNYTSHYVGLASKTFMGGGIYVAATSDEIADNFFAAIAQDIVERWNHTERSNAIENLEACLFLTQSSCKVPDQLEPELKTKIINLSQYLQKGGLKK